MIWYFSCVFGLPFGWFWQSFAVLRLKQFVWPALLQEKKRCFARCLNISMTKNLKTPISLSLKAIAAWGSSLCQYVSYAYHDQNALPWVENHFSGRLFKGQHQVQNLLSKVPAWGWMTSSGGRGTPLSTSTSSNTPNGPFSGPKSLQ